MVRKVKLAKAIGISIFYIRKISNILLLLKKIIINLYILIIFYDYKKIVISKIIYIFFLVIKALLFYNKYNKVNVFIFFYQNYLFDSIKKTQK
jgi:hypothetical protein